MCLPTEQSPAHVEERERKERAFPLRFFAFPDGCFARERAWIGATYSWRKAPARAMSFAHSFRVQGRCKGQCAWTAHREVAGGNGCVYWVAPHFINSPFRAFFFCNHRHRGIGLHFLGPSKNDVQSIHPSIHPDRFPIDLSGVNLSWQRARKEEDALARCFRPVSALSHGGGPAPSLSLALAARVMERQRQRAQSAMQCVVNAASPFSRALAIAAAPVHTMLPSVYCAYWRPCRNSQRPHHPSHP